MRAQLRRSQHGNALVEYVILLFAIVLLVAALVTQYGQNVEQAWAQGDEEATSGASEVTAHLDSDSESGCNAYYNAATGRWHDSDTNLFISFDDAASSGCS